MNPFAPIAHVGAPELVGYVRTMDQVSGVSPGAMQAAMHAVMGTPAFAQLARGIAHSGQAAPGCATPAPACGPQGPQNWMPVQWGQLPGAIATVGPAPAAPAYQGGPGVAYGSMPTVIERPLTDIREFPLGFGPTSFPAGTEASVISRPQVVFRGERLVVPSTVAPFFSIIDIKVGNRSQLVNSVALPAQMFIETAVGIRLSFDTAAVAQDVALIVANGSASATTFQAAIIGTAAQ
jgi:hypothetical protein